MLVQNDIENGKENDDADAVVEQAFAADFDVEFLARARECGRLPDQAAGFLVIVGVQRCKDAFLIGRERAECRAGAHALVAQRYPDAQAWVVEPEPGLQPATAQALASPWWSAKRWRGGRTHLFEPLPEGGVDPLWANMALHMAADPEALIGLWHRQVAVDGFLMFSCLGPDTVRELRALHARLGGQPAGHEFTDMHDWGDMLVHAGFAEPVMDMERIVLTWGSPEAALAELRTLGRNLHPGRFPALRGRWWRGALMEALGDLAAPGEHDGRIALTFEVIYGHAFRPAARVSVANESTVSLRDMKAMLGRGRPG